MVTPANQPVRIGILGAGGRMGREVILAVRRTPVAHLSGAVEHADHPCVGAKLDEGHCIGANALPLAHASDVLIDFTEPGSTFAHLEAAQAARRPVLIGTTGLTAAHHAEIDNAARRIAVLQAANTSLGVTLLAELTRLAAARLADWDAEILDLHHAQKADAPSGTALLLADSVAEGRGVGTRAPARTGKRRPGEIGIASLRGGSAAGDHSVFLLGPGERLELTHRAESRAVFAHGAVQAALWLARAKPGRYTMRDVLGL